MTSQESGKKGEAVAALYYIKQGYQLLDHNFKTRMGELDLVLKNGQQIVIAEVKTRSEVCKYRPSEAVNYAKRKRIVLAAKRYLQLNGYYEHSIRFDVVEVFVKSEGGFAVHCIKDAFSL